MKLRLMVILTSVFFVNYVQSQDIEGDKLTLNNLIIGKWCYPDSSQNYIQYYPNGVVKRFIGNEQSSQGYYHLEQQSDTIFDQNSLNEKRRPIRIRGDYMESFGFKMGKGIQNHIDEYSLLVRETEGRAPLYLDSEMPITKYILPKGFRGLVVIAYNQTQGIEPEYDLEGNRIIRIPLSGLLETKFPEDAFGTAGRRYRVYMEDSLAQNLIELPVADKFDFKKRSSFFEEKTVVIMLGFNQNARADVNMVFKKNIEGNVMMFFVGSAKESAQLNTAKLELKIL